jgi:hypothetical protein
LTGEIGLDLVTTIEAPHDPAGLGFVTTSSWSVPVAATDKSAFW